MKSSRTQKISLAILSLVVFALLAPYAGCNQIFSGTRSEPESASEPEDIVPLASPHSTETDTKKGEPLEQIEDLLSD